MPQRVLAGCKRKIGCFAQGEPIQHPTLMAPHMLSRDRERKLWSACWVGASSCATSHSREQLARNVARNALNNR